MSINKRKILASAQKHMQKGATDKALKDYQTLLEADPKDVNLRLKVGDLYLRLNKSDEAVTAYLKVAERFMKDGFDAKAVALYKQITRIDSKRVDVYVPLAELYQRLGLTSDAMSALQTAADACYRDGDKPAALELMRKMATLDPSNTTSRLKVAELLRQEGMREEALAELEAVAVELERQGEVEGRASVLQKVVELDAVRFTAIEGLGRCLLAMKKWSQAEELAQRLIEAGSETSVEGYEILAEACQGLRREDELPEIYRSMVAALRERGDESRAREIAQRFTTGVVSAEVSEAAVIEAPDLDAAVGGGSVSFGEDPIDEAGFISDASGRLADLGDSFSGGPAANRYADGRRRSATSSTPFSPPPFPPASRDAAGGGKQFLDESEADSAPAPQAPAADAEQLLAEAGVYLRYGKHERAIEGLRALLVREPRHRRALEKFGEACAAAEQVAQAIDAWRRSADLAAAEGDSEAVERIRGLAAAIDPAAAASIGASPKRAEAAPAAVEDPLEIEIDEIEPEQLGGPAGSDDDELSFDLDASEGEDLESVEAELSFPGDAKSSADFSEAGGVSDTSDASDPGESNDGVMVRESVEYTDSFATSAPVTTSDELEFEIDVDTSEAELSGADDRREASDSDGERLSEDDDVDEATITGSSSTTPQQVVEGMAEAELFLSQGMFPEAEVVCRRLLEVVPGHPKVLLRLGEVEAARGNALREAARAKQAAAARPAPADDEDTGEVKVSVGAGAKARAAEEAAKPAEKPAPKPTAPLPPVAVEAPEPEPEAEREPEPMLAPAPAFDLAAAAESGDFDLAAALSDAFEERAPGAGSSTATEEEGFQQVFAAFKAGVEKQLGAQDYDARFDLGIAYKEMGLLDDAIGEFRVAFEGPDHKLQCLHMMGVCALDVGRPADAVAHIEQALAMPDLPGDQQMALRFDLGRAYQVQGDRVRARSAWEAVAVVDPEFCDVRDRIAELDAEPAIEGTGEGEDGEAFESFDDLMSESLADGAEPKHAKAAKGPAYESFDDFMGGDDDDEAEEGEPEDETQVAEISAAEVAEPEPAPPPAPVAPPSSKPPPEPPAAKRKKKISFV